MAKISFQMDEAAQGPRGIRLLTRCQAELADTPWRRAGTNLSDFFNFGMSEDEFKERPHASLLPLPMSPF